METKMEQFSATNTNPVLRVDKGGTVLYSNEAGKPLLQEWGVVVGGKLPSYIGDLVQRVITRNSPEKMEIDVGKGVYLIVFHPLPEQKCVNISGFDISDQKEVEEKPRESEALEMMKLELAEIFDVQAIQSLMNEFYKLVPITMALVDLKGNVLVSVGWQDICTKFHRVYSEPYRYCVESDTKLSAGIPPGEFKLYKCKNNMWDTATPIIAGGRHVGNIFSGQFFFEDEPLDYELFRSQARRYGFNEKEYIAALEKVPHLSMETVNTCMTYLAKLANMISQLSYSNIKLAQSLAERNALVDALRESEERYRNIIETTNEGVWLFNSLAETTYVNEKMAEMLGYNRAEIIGRFIWDFAGEEDKGIFQVKLANRKKGIDEVYELKLVRKEGSYLWLLVSAKAFFDDAGKFAGSIGMFTDITERKNAEEALRLSNIYNRSLIEASLDPLVTIGLNGKITDVNEATEKVTGYSRNELIETDFFDYFTEYEKTRKGYQQVFTDGKVRDYPLEIQHKDGHITPVLYNASVYKDENGEVIGAFAAARDITERKKAERALRESEEKYRIVADNTFDWEFWLGPDGRFLYTSPSCERVTGYAAWEFIDKPDLLQEIIHPDDRQAFLQHQHDMPSSRHGDIEFRIVTKDGEIRWIHHLCQPLYDGEGRYAGSRGSNRETTERKRAEETLACLLYTSPSPR